MKFHTLPGTDLEISEVGFGAWTVGTTWWGDRGPDDAERLLAAALDNGMTFIDTADAYGDGASEEIVGKFLAGRRGDVVLATKFGYDIYNHPASEQKGHGERPQDFSGAFIRQALEKSLARLGTDYVDLYQAHNLKLPQFNDEMFATLEALKDEGKIRAWGVALGPAIGWREEGLASFLNHNAATVQTVFNAFEQDPGRELCQVAEHSGGAVLARVPHCTGLLKDIYSKDTTFAPGDHRNYRDGNWLKYGLAKVDAVRFLAEENGMTVGQAALKWLAAQPRMICSLPTCMSEDEVIEFAAAADKPDLSADQLARVQELYESDFDLPDDAHPCDLKSSTDPSGRVRSGYVKPELQTTGTRD